MSHSWRADLIGTIEDAGEAGSAIFGVTVLKEELFVLGFYNETIKVYDATSYELKKSWRIPGLICPGDIKTLNDRLLVIDWKEKGQLKNMFIVSENGEIQGQWTHEDDFGRLSLTPDKGIIEDCHDQNAIAEYSTTGEQLHKYPIPRDQGIGGLQHAIKRNDGSFLLSHGDPKDKLHRVCVVNDEGRIQVSFGGEPGGGDDQVNVPVYLAVLSTGEILVADKFNRRIVLLTADLKFQKTLVQLEGCFPVKMFLDEPKRKLYLAANEKIDGKWRNGKVEVYEMIKDP